MKNPTASASIASPMSRPESVLLLALGVAVLAAFLGPHVTQHVHYHAFADQREIGRASCRERVLMPV